MTVYDKTEELLLESEKGGMYWAFDTTELLKGDMLKRYQAYQIALQSNFMQIDEVRYKEDLPRLGFNFIKLGLDDVLYDPKTGTVYTANTNQMVKIGEKRLQSEGDGGIIETEKRYNPNHDPKSGKFTSGNGSVSVAYDSSGKPYKYPTLKLDRQEYGKVVHEINTVYHARFKGMSIGNLNMAFDNGYYCYRFEIHGFDNYNIFERVEI